MAERTEELANTNQKLQDTLEEKVVLLKELHHRVKNNMQVVTSLLNLQSKRIKDKPLQAIFRENQNRIKSMALIHEELYKTKDLSKINFSEYTRIQTGRLRSSYGIGPNTISIIVCMDSIMLSIDVSIPCGLIINELVSNSLKYAFPSISTQETHEDKKYKIEISMRRVSTPSSDHAQNSRIELIVSDNGIGLPDDLDFQNTKTFGLELVNSLVFQLDGDIELKRDGGTEFKITFEA